LITIPKRVLVEVLDAYGNPQQGVPFCAFDVVPFWSGEANLCTLPGCTLANVTVTILVTVTVEDSLGMPQEGIPVYAFSGGSYTGKNGTTDANGEVTFTLLQGSYRFRADSGGTQFWSGETDHCTIPGCLDASVVVTVPLTVSVEDTNGAPKEGVPVYVFDGSTYTGFNATTDANGDVTFTLPEGSYRFRSDLNGTQFWSGETDHCTIPGCLDAVVVVTVPLTVTVMDTDLVPQEGLPVYAFSGGSYTGFNGTTDANGEAVFTLPQGSLFLSLSQVRSMTILHSLSGYSSDSCVLKNMGRSQDACKVSMPGIFCWAI
jgi:hypothetical protein